MSKQIHPAPFVFIPGASPLLVSVPHSGLELLPGMDECLTPAGRGLVDTDWCVDELYKWVTKKGVGLLVAGYSRYVVDLNRPADDSNLYQAKTTGLFPQYTFAGDALWLKDTHFEFSHDWIKENIWQAYHAQIEKQLQRLREEYSYAMLLDAHSIAAEVPALFSGALEDLNLGSYSGKSADHSLIEAVWQSLDDPEYSRVLDGRFKGGAITRAYGKPENNIHALQLELSQATYLNSQSSPPQLDPSRTAQIQVVLSRMVDAMLEWRPFDHG